MTKSMWMILTYTLIAGTFANVSSLPVSNSLDDQPCTKLIVASASAPYEIGNYTPQCDEASGRFTPRQCHGSIGYCWCVHPLTNVALTQKYRIWELRDAAPDCSKLAEQALATTQNTQNTVTQA